jgi:hypothetical protein
MEPYVRDQDVAVVGDEVFDDFARALDDVDVAPVHPAVVGLEGSAKQVVPRPGHGLAPRSLGFELVAVLYTLFEFDAKVLLYNQSRVERVLWVVLDSLELHSQRCHRVVG